eukprot:15468337-Alexandrium_andersonii.AAC.1
MADCEAAGSGSLNRSVQSLAVLEVCQWTPPCGPWCCPCPRRRKAGLRVAKFSAGANTCLWS